MSEVRVDRVDEILLRMKVNVLIANMGCNAPDFNIQAFQFLASTKDFEVCVKGETASWSGPLAMSDILSSIA
jgi:hypothetical protein